MKLFHWSGFGLCSENENNETSDISQLPKRIKFVTKSLKLIEIMAITNLILLVTFIIIRVADQCSMVSFIRYFCHVCKLMDEWRLLVSTFKAISVSISVNKTSLSILWGVKEERWTTDLISPWNIRSRVRCRLTLVYLLSPIDWVRMQSRAKRNLFNIFCHRIINDTMTYVY